MNTCPCGLDHQYKDCCGRFIDQHHLPKTPEELMRSRYTAYTLGNVDYISKTMKSPASDNFDRQSAKNWAMQADWKKLEVLKSCVNNETGTVEFIAYYFFEGMLQTIHEISQFKRDHGMWFYVDGIHVSKQI